MLHVMNCIDVQRRSYLSGHCILHFVMTNLAPFDPLSFGSRIIALCVKEQQLISVHSFVNICQAILARVVPEKGTTFEWVASQLD